MAMTLALLVGTVVGGAAVFLVTRNKWRASTARLLEAANKRYASQLAEARAGGTLVAEFGTAKDADNIRFLYDKRLTLFNTRREHEWKIYFGALALLGAADAVIVAGDLILSHPIRYAWIAACVMVILAVLGYERELQIRNDADRTAMDRLFNRLCELVGIDDSSVRESTHDAEQPRPLWYRYGWAFPWQMILLLLVAGISAYLPWIA